MFPLDTLLFSLGYQWIFTRALYLYERPARHLQKMSGLHVPLQQQGLSCPLSVAENEVHSCTLAAAQDARLAFTLSVAEDENL